MKLHNDLCNLYNSNVSVCSCDMHLYISQMFPLFFFIAECIIALYWTCYHFLCGIYLVEAGFLEFHLLFSSLH